MLLRFASSMSMILFRYFHTVPYVLHVGHRCIHVRYVLTYKRINAMLVIETRGTLWHIQPSESGISLMNTVGTISATMKHLLVDSIGSSTQAGMFLMGILIPPPHYARQRNGLTSFWNQGGDSQGITNCYKWAWIVTLSDTRVDIWNIRVPWNYRVIRAGGASTPHESKTKEIPSRIKKRKSCVPLPPCYNLWLQVYLY